MNSLFSIVLVCLSVELVFAKVLYPPFSFSDRNSTFDVRTYGAVGNGVSDDSAAFQTTIDQCVAVTTGCNIYIPSGLYLLTKTLHIPTKDSAPIQIFGDGWNSQCLWSSDADLFVWSGDTATSVCMRDFKIRSIGQHKSSSNAAVRFTVFGLSSFFY